MNAQFRHRPKFYSEALVSLLTALADCRTTARSVTAEAASREPDPAKKTTGMLLMSRWLRFRGLFHRHIGSPHAGR